MTATRTPERPAEPFPSLPLEPLRHQQVRALLVREAAAPRRPAAARWAVPVGVGAVAAAVAAAVALGGGQLLGADGRGDPAVVPDRVDCSLGIVPGAIDDVPDAWRLMSDAPGDLVVTNSVRLEPTTCPGQPAGYPTDRPVQALAALAADGTVTAAVTVWSDAPARTGEGTAVVTVRGVQGTVQTGTTQYGTERVWWSEGGQDLSVSSSGLDRAALLALVEQVGPDGVLPADAIPAGMAALPFELPEVLEPYEPEWSAEYVVPGTGADPQVEPKGIGVRVSRTTTPWQAELSQQPLGGTAPRVVDVDGRPGVLFSNGGPDLWLRYSLGEGVQVFVGGLGDGMTGGALAFAGTLAPAASDDPRIRELDWDAVLSTDGP